MFKVATLSSLGCHGRNMSLYKIPVATVEGVKMLPELSFQLTIWIKSATKLGISHFMIAELPKMTYSLSASVSYS